MEIKYSIGIALFAGGLILLCDGVVEWFFEKRERKLSKGKLTRGGARTIVGLFFLIISYLVMFLGV